MMMMSSIAILLLGLSSLTNAQKTADKQADVTYRHRRIKSLPWVNKGRYYHYYRAEAGPTDYDDETSVQPSEQSFQPPPHKPPSSSSSPTCLNNFNICYSLDMSGSVCSNNNNPLVCDQCGYTGSGSMCGDAEFGFIDFNTCGSSCNCCNNWKSITNFTRDIINEIRDNVEADSVIETAIVSFSTTGTLESDLNPVDAVSLNVLEDLKYTGGFTNHEDAISVCQGVFDPTKKNIIVLITDGVSSRPQMCPISTPSYDNGGPGDCGITSANTAKAAGTLIRPVFITTSYGTNKDNAEGLAYMEELSNADEDPITGLGKVYTGGFADLPDLVDEVTANVLCESEPTASPTSTVYPEDTEFEPTAAVQSQHQSDDGNVYSTNSLIMTKSGKSKSSKVAAKSGKSKGSKYDHDNDHDPIVMISPKSTKSKSTKAKTGKMFKPDYPTPIVATSSDVDNDEDKVDEGEEQSFPGTAATTIQVQDSSSPTTSPPLSPLSEDEDDEGEDQSFPPTTTSSLPATAEFTSCFDTEDGGRYGVLYNAVRSYVDQDCANDEECEIGQTYGWPMNSWCVGNVKDMSGLFSEMDTFNEDISDWNTSSVSDMNWMFSRAKAFNQDLLWNTSSVTDMSYMFWEATSFNGDVSNFDTSRVTNMNSIFEDTSFNGDLSNFDTSSVTTMLGMFSGASSFNRDVSSFDTSSVFDMAWMFAGATAFNRDISNFDTSSVSRMNGMFRGASLFNGDVSNFDTSRVADMRFMFEGASSFDQDLCSWRDSFPYNLAPLIFEDSGCTYQDTPQEDQKGPFCASDCQ